MRMSEVQKYEMLKRYYSYCGHQMADNNSKDVPCSLRASKLQKLESELQKVYAAHEELTMSFARMEKLERNMRLKLELEIGLLKDENANLKADIALQKNELEAQRLTIKDQRDFINLLDGSLKVSQKTVTELESELHRLKSLEKNSSQLGNTIQNDRTSSTNSNSVYNSNCSSQENNATQITPDDSNNANNNVSSSSSNRSSIIRALLAERNNLSEHPVINGLHKPS